MNMNMNGSGIEAMEMLGDTGRTGIATAGTALAAILIFSLAPSLVAQDSLRVLFLGNSHTFFNNLPGQLEDLVQSGGHFLEAQSNTPGGHTLEGHSQNPTSLGLIAEGGWDHVILQEQSQIPTIAHWRETRMYPAARLLDSLISLQNSATMFYQTWGWEFGGQQCIDDCCSVEFADYFHMQDTVTAAYDRIAEELEAGIAPAGEGFRAALTADPESPLWAQDHYHPSAEGTYMTACVFYVSLTGESPEGLGYTGGLSEERAAFYQEIAGQILGLDGKTTGLRPGWIRLLPPRPNPFNPIAWIEFELDRPARVRLQLFDLRGARAAQLLDASRGPGRHRLLLDAGGLPAGVYFCRLSAGNQQRVRPLTLLK